MKLINVIVVSLYLVLTTTRCLGQYAKDTLHILFVGNSYTYVLNIPHIVSLISDSTQTKLITSKSTAGGSRLSDHWNGNRGLKTKEKIKNGNYDIVVLQEQSMGTIEQPDSFLIYSRKLCNYIKENNAQPYFFETWAREKVPQNQEIITEVYAQAAIENGAGIVKVGQAWALARQLRPKAELYISDGSHQSQLGAYLAACVFVGTITNDLPDQLPRNYTISDNRGEEIFLLMALDPLDITFCLRVAGEIVREKSLINH